VAGAWFLRGALGVRMNERAHVVYPFVGERKIKIVYPEITTPALVLPILGGMHDTHCT